MDSGKRWSRQTAVATARSVINGDIGIIEGSIKLFGLSHKFVATWHTDPDFRIFGSLASETDHLPTGSARQHWSASALARADQNIARIEENARADVMAACHNVIACFTIPENEIEN